VFRKFEEVHRYHETTVVQARPISRKCFRYKRVSGSRVWSGALGGAVPIAANNDRPDRGFPAGEGMFFLRKSFPVGPRGGKIPRYPGGSFFLLISPLPRGGCRNFKSCGPHTAVEGLAIVRRCNGSGLEILLFVWCPGVETRERMKTLRSQITMACFPMIRDARRSTQMNSRTNSPGGASLFFR